MDEDYLARLEAMTEEDRAYFLQEEMVHAEERSLQWMVDQNKADDELIKLCTSKTQQAMKDYELFGSQDALDEAEDWLLIAKDTKEHRLTIGDIRKQRERIWQEKKKLQQMRKPSTELTQS